MLAVALTVVGIVIIVIIMLMTIFKPYGEGRREETVDLYDMALKSVMADLHEKEVEDTFTPYEQTEQVYCNDCGVAVKKDMAQEVMFGTGYYSPHSLYYCDRHTKKYDKVESGQGGIWAYYKTTPETTVEVTEKGRLIKKKS